MIPRKISTRAGTWRNSVRFRRLSSSSVGPRRDAVTPSGGVPIGVCVRNTKSVNGGLSGPAGLRAKKTFERAAFGRLFFLGDPHLRRLLLRWMSLLLACHELTSCSEAPQWSGSTEGLSRLRHEHVLYWNGDLSNLMAEAPRTWGLEGFAPAR
jgi:hypothetical protein